MIYDLLNKKAHCLNETTTRVWRGCDGKTTVYQLTKNQKPPEEYVTIALMELQKANLLEKGFDPEVSPDRFSRRKMLMKAGACAPALPLITSIVTLVSAQTLSNAWDSIKPLN